MSSLLGPVVSGPTPELFGSPLSAIGGFMTTGGLALANGVFNNYTNSIISSVGGYLDPLQILQDKAINSLGKLIGGPAASSLFSQLDFSTLTGGLTNSLKVLRNKGEAQKSFKWMVLMPDISSGNSTSNLPNWMVLSVTPSFTNTTTDQYWIGGQPTFFGADQVSNPLSLTFYLDESQTSLNYMIAWRGLLRNSDRTFNYASKYKRPIYLTLLSGQDVPVIQIIMQGCFPTTMSLGTLTYGTSSHMTVQANFTVDDTITSFSSNNGYSIDQLLTNPLGVAQNALGNAASELVNSLSKYI